MSDTIDRPRPSSSRAPDVVPDQLRELRLALVCYGGVSLAIYMHGITVELQSLVTASAVFCEKPTDINPFSPDRTEHVYWKALAAMAKDKTDGGAQLRIVLDIISGTSAGGINGIVLAKALAMGVRQDPLRTVWFDKASILKLLNPFPRPGRSNDGTRPPPRAPLNGRLMSTWAFGALQAMNTLKLDHPACGVPLVPKGNDLDLFVTTTDCAGLRRTLDLYNPEEIHDLEYRQVFRFNHDPEKSDVTSFCEKGDRMLTMAARSTSSFPGAFPPVTMAEIGSIAQPFGPMEIETHFPSYLLEGANPQSAYFLDGGVLNNRPFDHAVDAIMTRRAGREVERRLLFIEPHPVDLAAPPADGPAPPRPSWLHTVAAALSAIPSHQPIADALAELTRHNVRASEIRQLIALTEPSVFELIQQTANDRSEKDKARTQRLAGLELDEIETWANRVADAARAAVGVCYGPYEAIKVGEVIADLSEGLCSLPRYPVTSRHAALVSRIVQCWARGRGLMLNDTLARPRRVRKDDKAVKAYRGSDQARKDFLQAFDMNFRIRRLRFLIRCVNDTYAESASDPNLRPTLDGIKSSLYGLVRKLREIKSGDWVKDDQVLSAKLKALFDQKPIADFLATQAGGSNQGLDAKAICFIDTHRAGLDAAFQELDAKVRAKYQAFHQEQKAALDALRPLEPKLPPGMLQQLLARYVGFTYWDAILYPLIAMSGVSEPDQVEVVRLSPDDSNLLNPKTAAKRLKGITAFHFGAFLKRSYRENDFLWGRLDAVERLLGVLAGIEKSGLAKPEQTALAWQGFKAVLDSEGPTFTTRPSKKLVACLQDQVTKALALNARP